MTQESWQPSKSMEMQSVFHMCWSWGEVVACFKEATRGRQEPCLPNLGSAQLLRPIRFLATPWTAAHQASLSITDSWSLLRLVSIELVMPPNRLILCHPLLPPPSVFPSSGVFSSGSVLRIRWPEYWNFNISPYNEYSGLIAFRMDWLDLLAVQETLKTQEPSPTPQFKSINSLALSRLYGPTLTCTHDHWNYCIQNRWPTRTYCIAQGTILSIL